MSRLRKNEIETIKNTYEKYDGISNEAMDNLCNELLEYKKLEEELGFDLITLFKALKNGIYAGIRKEHIEPYSSDMSCGWFDINIENKSITYNVVRKNEYQMPRYFYFNDYGKWWALTKEELRK